MVAFHHHHSPTESLVDADMQVVPSLPPEIVDHILKSAVEDLPFPVKMPAGIRRAISSPIRRVYTRYDFLTSVSRVCRTWRDLARPILWKTVVLYHSRSAQSFILAQEAGENYSTRSLTVRTPLSDEQYARFMNLASDMSALRNLDLGEVRGQVPTPLTLLLGLESFSTLCPGIHCLMNDATSKEAIPSHLEKLCVRISSEDSQGDHLNDEVISMAAILTSPLKSLRIELSPLAHISPHRADFLKRLAAVAPSLERLSLDVPSTNSLRQRSESGGAQLLAHFLSLCTSLRHLTLTTSILSLLPSLPPSLIRLRVYHDIWKEVGTDIDRLAGGSGNLKEIVVGAWADAGVHTYRMKMKDAYAGKRMVLATEMRMAMWRDGSRLVGT